ncbi:hypothetical protein SC867_07555 [Legionella pneumophila serogroup 2]|nr:hypothetical protein [Legionella pneumophila]AGH55140.1 hypothetical protein LPE509_03049 [Legionella pneumophila subsp. pneumophila LPE509]
MLKIQLGTLSLFIYAHALELEIKKNPLRVIRRYFYFEVNVIYC